MEKAVELALNGDIQALRLCIERLLPKAVPSPGLLAINQVFQDTAQINIINSLYHFKEKLLYDLRKSGILLRECGYIADVLVTEEEKSGLILICFINIFLQIKQILNIYSDLKYNKPLKIHDFFVDQLSKC